MHGAVSEAELDAGLDHVQSMLRDVAAEVEGLRTLKAYEIARFR